MRAILIFMVMTAAFLLTGCATILDVADSACETAFGGSKAYDACKSLDHLRPDPEEEAVVSE